MGQNLPKISKPWPSRQTATRATHIDSKSFFLYKRGITVPRDVTHVSVDPSITVLPAEALHRLRHLKEVVLPEGLQGIGNNALCDCSLLRRINIPSTLTVIGRRAFCNCSSLREVVLPEGLHEIGDNAFMGCTLLERINIPSTLAVINCMAFHHCGSLRGMVLPEGLREIGNNAFGDCTYLQRIHIQSTLTVIGCQFNKCNSLREMVLPEGLQEIGNNAFMGCTLLERINFPSTLTVIGRRAFCNCPSLRGAVLPEGLRDIGSSVFKGCTSLKRINIPSTLTVIGYEVFCYCTSLREVVLQEGFQEIGVIAFSDCTLLEQINIPSTLTLIGFEAFCNCTSLREVVLPEGLREIRTNAFGNCISLERINIPSTLTAIDCKAFSHCVALKEVQLREGIRAIRSHAFWYCCSLLLINIPSSVTEIDEHAFEDCNLLRNVAISSTSFRQEMFDRFTSLRSVDCSLAMLEARFDELPIHMLCYYYQHQSVGTITLGQLSTEVNTYEPTKLISQDCLGMTPLHIIASSGKHDIEVYELLIEKCPNALIIQDKWGETPLKYALLSEAPLNVVNFLLGKHCTKWGQVPFDFGEAVKSLVEKNGTTVEFVPLAEKNGTSVEFVQSIIRAQRTSFPNLSVDWGRIVDESVGLDSMPIKMFRVLVEAIVSKRSNCMSSEHQIEINARINEMSNAAAGGREEREQLRRLITDYAQLYYHNLKEATTLIELALWKAKLDELNIARINTDRNCRKRGRYQRKENVEALTREECRVKCGVEEVVPGILSYL